MRHTDEIRFMDSENASLTDVVLSQGMQLCEKSFYETYWHAGRLCSVRAKMISANNFHEFDFNERT